MDFGVVPQYVIVTCRLTVPRVNHLIDLINSWSVNSIEYEQGAIVQGQLFWVPGSLEPFVPVNGGGGGNGGGFGGGFEGNNQQAFGANFVLPDEVDILDHGVNEAIYDHGTGHDYLNKRKRKMEQSKSQKKLKQE